MYLPVARPDLGDMERQNLVNGFDSGWISSKGTYVDEFEESWAGAISVQKALAVANGTVALHLALKALGIGPGDEVIVPSLTFIATANAVTYVGAIPVFCDVNQNTWNIDVENAMKVLTSKTRALICVHLYGVPCDMVSLIEFAESNGIYLVEDAAEAPFATFSGKPIGGFGVISTFSFYGNKIITSGEGGAVCTNDESLATTMSQLRNQGMSPDVRYYFDKIGFNFRLTNLQCAILCAQMDRRHEFIKSRLEMYKFYNKILGDFPVSWQLMDPRATISPWLYTCLLPSESTRKSVQEELSQRGIETRPIFIPLHTLPPYRRDDNADSFIESLRIAECGISLPTYSNISLKESEYLSDSLVYCFKKVFS